MGIRIRTRPTLPTRMILFDRTVAVIPLDPEVLAEGAVVIDHATIVHLLHSLFEVHWKDSEPVSRTAPAQPAEGPRPMELAVLNLLALGYKDEAIARSTGQSTRTVRRLVAGMAVTLEARSRFDLALRASARGWIDSPFD
jgi:DNA-binding NarL/FixJ family response regulator